MNAAMKQHLEAVVSSIINEDTSAAKDSFHEYLRLKTQELLLGEGSDEADEDSEDKDSEDKDSEDKDSEDKDSEDKDSEDKDSEDKDSEDKDED